MKNVIRKIGGKCLKCFCLLLIIFVSITTNADNKAFQSGETLQYDLYYNWKFIWVKAGDASMSIISTYHDGIPAYRSRMLTRGSSKADKFFVLRDTLTSITATSNLRPLYYSKTDMEGTSYRQREVWYSYPEKGCKVKQKYINPDGKVSWKDEYRDARVFDMLSILLEARTYNPSGWEKGHKIQFEMTDGDGINTQTLIYRGKKNIKIRNGNDTYRCLVLSFVEYEKKKEKEVITFYVTDDDNHIPVRLDMFLRIGSAKAFLVGYRGLKNKMSAKK